MPPSDSAIGMAQIEQGNSQCKKPRFRCFTSRMAAGSIVAAVFAWLAALESTECHLFTTSHEQQQPLRGRQAVVVLGYALKDDGHTPTELLLQRIAAGVRLAARVRAHLIFSGGLPPLKLNARLRRTENRSLPQQSQGARPPHNPNGLCEAAASPTTWMRHLSKRCRRPEARGFNERMQISEAEAMAKHARNLFPEQMRRVRSVMLEGASRTTRENAVFTIALIHQHLRQIRSLHVVTNRFHQRRACATFTIASREFSGRRQLRARPHGAGDFNISCVWMPPSTHAFQLQGAQRQTCALDASRMNVCWALPLAESKILIEAVIKTTILMLRETGALVKYGMLGYIPWPW